MKNCFCGIVDRRKAFIFISSRDHCQRSSPSQISDTPRAGFEPAQNLDSGFVESSCAVVLTKVWWNYPPSHVTFWPRGYVTKKIRYIWTSTAPMLAKPVRVLTWDGETYPTSHGTFWPRSYVTIEKHYICTFTSPITRTLGKIVTQVRWTPPTKSRDDVFA